MQRGHWGSEHQSNRSGLWSFQKSLAVVCKVDWAPARRQSSWGPVKRPSEPEPAEVVWCSASRLVTHSCWSFAQLCSPAATPGFRAEEDRRPRKPRGGRCFVADASRGAVWDISETLPRTAGGRPLSEAEGECPWVSAAPRGALLACDGKRSAAVTFFPRVSSSGIARSG